MDVNGKSQTMRRINPDKEKSERTCRYWQHYQLPRSRRADGSLANNDILGLLRDLEFLLPLSQQPAYGVYHTPVDLRQHSHMQSVWDSIRFSIILSSWPKFQMIFFFHILPLNPWTQF